MYSFSEYRSHFTQLRFTYIVARSIALICISSLSTIYARRYATASASNHVSDLILSNIPTYNIAGIFIFGGLLMIVGVTLLVLAKPVFIPFSVSTIALFYISRSFCIILTHIKADPSIVSHDFDGTMFGNLSDALLNGSDLFFSGHTGLPFLMALIFWNHTIIRYVCICVSVFFAIIVLLGHIHYSIDVVSAYCITYTIYRISERIFHEEHALFTDHARTQTTYINF